MWLILIKISVLISKSSVNLLSSYIDEQLSALLQCTDVPIYFDLFLVILRHSGPSMKRSKDEWKNNWMCILRTEFVSTPHSFDAHGYWVNIMKVKQCFIYPSLYFSSVCYLAFLLWWSLYRVAGLLRLSFSSLVINCAQVQLYSEYTTNTSHFFLRCLKYLLLLCGWPILWQNSVKEAFGGNFFLKMFKSLLLFSSVNVLWPWLNSVREAFGKI